MTANLRRCLADALRKHLIALRHDNYAINGQVRLSVPRVDVESLADVLLSLPGVAIVELPEPPEESTWHGGDVGDVISDAHCGGVRICGVGNNLCTTTSEARKFAAALLAAANKAEAGQ